MKVRSDLVTNSSSSSFVVAYRDGVVPEEIMKPLLDNVENFIEMEEKYIEDEDFKELKTKEDKIKYVLKELYHTVLVPKKHCMNIGDWNITSMEFGSEDGEIAGVFFYSYCNEIDTPMFKVKAGWQ